MEWVTLVQPNHERIPSMSQSTLPNFVERAEYTVKLQDVLGEGVLPTLCAAASRAMRMVKHDELRRVLRHVDEAVGEMMTMKERTDVAGKEEAGQKRAAVAVFSVRITFP